MTRTQGTTILTLVSLFERFGYYGVRAIITLYIIDERVLHFDRDNIVQYFSDATLALLVLAIPIGLITDKILGQQKSILLGGTVSLLGYSLLNLFSSEMSLYIALALLMIGTSLSKPSITILVGRQFPKTDKRRSHAYLIYYMGVNLGAFLGILTIGFIGEKHGWQYSFLLAGISNLTYLTLYILFGSKITSTEENLRFQNQTKISNSTLHLILVFIALLVVNALLVSLPDIIENNALMNVATIEAFGQRKNLLVEHLLLNASAYIYLLFTIILVILWKWRMIPSTVKLFITSLSITLSAVLYLLVINFFESGSQLSLVLIFLTLITFVSTIIFPIVTSYLTRISPIEYSNSIYAVFYLLTYGLGNLIYTFHSYFNRLSYLLIIGLVVLSILIIFKHKIPKIVGGVD